jgi:hypothetical protein
VYFNLYVLGFVTDGKVLEVGDFQQRSVAAARMIRD